MRARPSAIFYHQYFAHEDFRVVVCSLDFSEEDMHACPVGMLCTGSRALVDDIKNTNSYTELEFKIWLHVVVVDVVVKRPDFRVRAPLGRGELRKVRGKLMPDGRVDAPLAQKEAKPRRKPALMPIPKPKQRRRRHFESQTGRICESKTNREAETLNEM